MKKTRNLPLKSFLLAIILGLSPISVYAEDADPVAAAIAAAALNPESAAAIAEAAALASPKKAAAIAAAMAAAFPTVAAEIAAAVTRAVPEAATEIAAAVISVVPEASTEITAAVESSSIPGTNSIESTPLCSLGHSHPICASADSTPSPNEQQTKGDGQVIEDVENEIIVELPGDVSPS